MRKEGKSESVESMRRAIAAQKGAVVAEHRGLTVAEVTVLRRKLREAGAEFRVVKNTLMRLAAKGTGFEELDASFTGPTAVAFAHGDPIAMAKVLKEYAVGNPKFRLKAGYLQGRALSAREVEALADVPPREVLVALLAGSLAAPISRFAMALSGPPRKFVYALDAVHGRKSEQPNA